VVVVVGYANDEVPFVMTHDACVLCDSTQALVDAVARLAGTVPVTDYRRD
jgi:hypothetical protein